MITWSVQLHKDIDKNKVLPFFTPVQAVQTLGPAPLGLELTGNSRQDGQRTDVGLRCYWHFA